MAERTEIVIPSHDGRLQLFARAYGPAVAERTIVCLHGLTRNSLDFDALARRLAAAGDRVLAFDQRGRGRSDRDAEAANYRLDVYAKDILSAFDRLGIERATLIGTSMGGLMAMLLAATAADRVVAMVLNDVGPEIDAAGLERIRSYVGQREAPASWAAAARLAALDNAVAFPDYGDADWLTFARRLYTQDAQGRLSAAYDPAIAEGLKPDRTIAVSPDLWPLWDTLVAVPILAVRGALSDILSQSVLERMAERHRGLQTVVVPDRGHAPMLDEPAALAGIERFLASLPIDRSSVGIDRPPPALDRVHGEHD